MLALVVEEPVNIVENVIIAQIYVKVVVQEVVMVRVNHLRKVQIL